MNIVICSHLVRSAVATFSASEDAAMCFEFCRVVSWCNSAVNIQCRPDLIILVRLQVCAVLAQIAKHTLDLAEVLALSHLISIQPPFNFISFPNCKYTQRLVKLGKFITVHNPRILRWWRFRFNVAIQNWSCWREMAVAFFDVLRLHVREDLRLQVIVAADVFPKIYLLLRDTDPMVRRNSATVVREVCKHTPELAQLIVATGGVAALVENIRDTVGNERLPGLFLIIHFSWTFFWLGSELQLSKPGAELEGRRFYYGFAKSSKVFKNLYSPQHCVWCLCLTFPTTFTNTQMIRNENKNNDEKKKTICSATLTSYSIWSHGTFGIWSLYYGICWWAYEHTHQLSNVMRNTHIHAHILYTIHIKKAQS